MSKCFYVADFDLWVAHRDSFRESHYITTDDPKKILVACVPHSDADAEHFERCGALCCDDAPVPDSHVDAMKVVGTQKGQSGKQVVAAAAAIHPAFKVR